MLKNLILFFNRISIYLYHFLIKVGTFFFIENSFIRRVESRKSNCRNLNVVPKEYRWWIVIIFIICFAITLLVCHLYLLDLSFLYADSNSRSIHDFSSGWDNKHKYLQFTLHPQFHFFDRGSIVVYTYVIELCVSRVVSYGWLILIASLLILCLFSYLFKLITNEIIFDSIRKLLRIFIHTTFFSMSLLCIFMLIYQYNISYRYISLVESNTVDPSMTFYLLINKNLFPFLILLFFVLYIWWYFHVLIRDSERFISILELMDFPIESKDEALLLDYAAEKDTYKSTTSYALFMKDKPSFLASRYDFTYKEDFHHYCEYRSFCISNNLNWK